MSPQQVEAGHWKRQHPGDLNSVWDCEWPPVWPQVKKYPLTWNVAQTAVFPAPVLWRTEAINGECLAVPLCFCPGRYSGEQNIIWTNKGKLSVICVLYYLYIHICCSVTKVMSNSVTPWTIAPQAPLSMGFPKAKIKEWIAMPSCMGSSSPSGQTHISNVSCIGRQVLYH